MSQGFTKALTIDTDPSFTLNSDSIVPSQKAVKIAVDQKANSLTEYTYATLPTASSNTGLRVWVTDVGINGGSEWRSDGTDWYPINGEVILYNDTTFRVLANGGNIVAGSTNTITQVVGWSGSASGNSPKYIEVYLPSVASTPAITAGWYTVETTGDTTGTILSGGVGSPAITFTVGAAITSVSTRTTIHTFNLPAGLFTTGCKMLIDTTLKMAGSTNSRSVYISLGGVDCYSQSYASATYATIYNMMYKIFADSIDAQTTSNAIEPGQLSANDIKTTVDMSVARTVNFDGIKTATGMRMITAGFTVRLIK